MRTSDATLCYMDSITHREMRNSSAEVLRRVEAGESMIITNHGRPAAVISPAARAPLDDLIERGQVREATSDLETLRTIARRVSDTTTSEILDDSRSRW